jgi:hypothetical protein
MILITHYIFHITCGPLFSNLFSPFPKFGEGGLKGDGKAPTNDNEQDFHRRRFVFIAKEYSFIFVFFFAQRTHRQLLMKIYLVVFITRNTQVHYGVAE